MKVVVSFDSNAEKFQVFENALANGGLYALEMYGVQLKFPEYSEVKKQLKQENPEKLICIEEVLTEGLKRGYTLLFKDSEGGMDDVELTADMMLQNIESVPNHFLQQIVDECDDGDTADAIVQWVLYKEIIFG